MDTPPIGFRNEHVCDQGLELDKALALVTLPQHFPVGHSQASNQVARRAPRAARRLVLMVASVGWSWLQAGFTRLDRGFLSPNNGYAIMSHNGYLQHTTWLLQYRLIDFEKRTALASVPETNRGESMSGGRLCHIDVRRLRCGSEPRRSALLRSTTTRVQPTFCRHTGQPVRRERHGPGGKEKASPGGRAQHGATVLRPSP
jgi:hypothetical protein